VRCSGQNLLTSEHLRAKPRMAPASLMRMLACSRLVFNRMLGLNLTYIAAGTFVEMYMALRAGECDVGITAVEMCVARARSGAGLSAAARCPADAAGVGVPRRDPGRTICLNTCPAPPFAPPEGDYETEGFDEATQANLCCMVRGCCWHTHSTAKHALALTLPPPRRSLARRI
jgi:hypothetical protein